MAGGRRREVAAQGGVAAETPQPPHLALRRKLLPLYYLLPLLVPPSSTASSFPPNKSPLCSSGDVRRILTPQQLCIRHVCSRHRCIDEDQADSISRPQLLCACKIPLCQNTSHTERNPGREYYACQKTGTDAKYICKTWIWVDLVDAYVEQMIKYCTRDSLGKLEEELSAVQKELEQKIEELSCLEIEMVELGCRERERVEQGQKEKSELQSQLLFLQSQIASLNSSASKFKIMRRLMILLCAMCWLIAPCPLVIALAATLILVLMYLV